MANEKNLEKGKATRFKSGDEAAKYGSKGGKVSGESKRNKKLIREILSEFLDSEIKDNPQFAKIAAKMGVESNKSVKDIFTMVCLLNSVKEGNLSDLERLVKLLGEDKQNENTDVISKLDEVLKGIDVIANE